MNDDSVLILEMAEEKMSKAIAHLEEALLSVRAGKASQHVLKGIMVEYYGMATPIEQVSSVTVPDAKTILIQPWDRNMIAPIERAFLLFASRWAGIENPSSAPPPRSACPRVDTRR